MTVYDVTVRTLTPLHIGDGNELRQGFDFAVRNGRTYRLDEDVILREKEAQVKPDAKGGYPLPERLLTDADFQNRVFFRYVLPGVPHSEEMDTRIRSIIKDIHDCRYIPGSSAKGAIRTALLYSASKHSGSTQLPINYQKNQRGRYIKEKAASNLEKAVFRPAKDTANHDLLRAFQVADSTPLSHADSPLAIVVVRVFSGEEPQTPISIEAIPQGKLLRSTIHVDHRLLSDHAQKFEWGERTDWFVHLPKLANAWAQDHLEREIAFAERGEFASPLQTYKQLLDYQTKLRSTQFLLQIGWASGWEGMTIGALLSAKEQLNVRDRFQLGRPPGWKGEWHPDPNQPFPKSRRYRLRSDQVDSDLPFGPLGWVLVELQARKESNP